MQAKNKRKRMNYYKKFEILNALDNECQFGVFQISKDQK